MQRPQMSMVLLMIIMAIILAVGGVLALSYIQRRPEVPEGSFTTQVEGNIVTVRIDPAREVRMAASVGLPVENPTPGAPPVDTPVILPTQAQQEPLPTAVPPTVTPPPPPPPPPPPAAPEPVIFRDYVVQQGDTVYSVAKPLETSIALIARHGLSSEDLVPGNVIKLPVGNPAFCPGRRPYAVAEGDTAFSIGRRFGISAEELRTINNLDANYTVFSGTIICVP